jgi:hypothetical protein
MQHTCSRHAAWVPHRGVLMSEVLLYLWVVRVGGDDGELRPWHYIYEGRRGRWGIPNMALHMRVGGDDGELRPCLLWG